MQNSIRNTSIQHGPASCFVQPWTRFYWALWVWRLIMVVIFSSLVLTWCGLAQGTIKLDFITAGILSQAYQLIISKAWLTGINGPSKTWTEDYAQNVAANIHSDHANDEWCVGFSKSVHYSLTWEVICGWTVFCPHTSHLCNDSTKIVCLGM